jgi:transposase
MEADYRVHLANPAKAKQYEGKKFLNDRHEARWLAHMLKLGILPEGHIYPKEERPVRDLLRKRSQMVRHRTAMILSILNLFARNCGLRLKGSDLPELTAEDVGAYLRDADLSMAMKSTLSVYHCLSEEVRRLEAAVKDRIKVKPEFKLLHTVPGIGPILTMTIMLETGTIHRFPKAGNYASYCRCVNSQWLSNGKRKGKGNAKNGNRYLAWAYSEAADHATRCHPRIVKYYQRKKNQRCRALALSNVANKLARACYYILRDQVPFDVEKAFA